MAILNDATYNADEVIPYVRDEDAIKNKSWYQKIILYDFLFVQKHFC